VERLGTLVFSDIPASTLYEFDPATDRVTCYRKPSNKANGNTYDHQGRLITCEHATSRVVREEADGSITVLASEYAGAELNSPNDVVVDKAGGIWFTDPPYGRMDIAVGVERSFPQPVRGLYRLGPDDGPITCWPTTSNARTGYVSLMTRGRCSSTTRPVCTSVASRSEATCCPATKSGSPGAGSGSARGRRRRRADGMKVDSEGNVFCCGPGGVHVFSPQGRCLGVVLVPEVVANFNWGDDDHKNPLHVRHYGALQLPALVAG